MGSHKSKLLDKNLRAGHSFSTAFGSREKTGTKLHDAMCRLFDHQHNMEQSQEKYQNQYVHRDVDVITASYAKDPVMLKSLWQIEGSMEVESITHGLLHKIWIAATEKTDKQQSYNQRKQPVLSMNIHDFEVVVKKFMLESRENSLNTLHTQLQVSMQGMRSIFEISLTREERKDEFAKQNADELRHRLKKAAIWLEWQEEAMRKYVNETFHLFEDEMDKLVIGLLNFFDTQRQQLLETKNQQISNCICITVPKKKETETSPASSKKRTKSQKRNLSKKMETPDRMCTYAMTSYDTTSKRCIVTYADPQRVPRVESVQLLLARVGITKVSLSSVAELSYHDKVNEKKASSLNRVRKTVEGGAKHNLFSTFSFGRKKDSNSEGASTKESYDSNHPGIRDTSDHRVVHVEEFCRWFLPAVQNVFTVQNLITESGFAHPDVRSLFKNAAIKTQVLPSFTDEPDALWYVRRKEPLNIHVPKEDESGEHFHGILEKNLKNNGEFHYRRTQQSQSQPTLSSARSTNTVDGGEEKQGFVLSEDESGEGEGEGGGEQREVANEKERTYKLTKWQVVEHGVFAFDTTGEMSASGGAVLLETDKQKQRKMHNGSTDSLVEMPGLRTSLGSETESETETGRGTKKKKKKKKSQTKRSSKKLITNERLSKDLDRKKSKKLRSRSVVSR